jgi:hypothetical protein
MTVRELAALYRYAAAYLTALPYTAFPVVTWKGRICTTMERWALTLHKIGTKDSGESLGDTNNSI